MRAEFQWRTQKGTRTTDNRDCAGIGVNAQGSLMIVTDGSTAGKVSGELARALVKETVDWFAAAPVVSAETLRDFLRELHRELAPGFPRGSTSYLIVILGEKDCFAAYAGDCTLGIFDGKGALLWITAPHTLANAVNELPLADIAKSKTRHLLTSSFRSKEFIAPTIERIEVSNGRLVLATDGFWAELGPDQQTSFLDSGRREQTGDQDDCSALLIRFSQLENMGEVHLVGGGPDTIYVRGAD